MNTASEYGSVPDDAVSFLLSEGFLSEQDCCMVVASGKGEFARSVSRAVRVMVCMDARPDSLERTRNAVSGGCRAEMFERDWNTYVPSRGRYDSCLISPSRLCFENESVLRMESVSSRSCIAVIPVRSDRRKLTKALIQSSGIMVPMPGFPEPHRVPNFFRSEGRDAVLREFTTTIECPEDELVSAMVSLCPPDIDRDELVANARDLASSVTSEGVSRYSASVLVLAWNVDPTASGV